MTRRMFAVLILVLASNPVQAHSPSNSYLRLDLGTQKPSIEWEIALRDLEEVVGIDVDGDGEITWGELRRRHSAITSHAAGHIQFFAATGNRCQVWLPQLQASRRAERGYAVLGGTIECPGQDVPARLEYALLLDIDPTHRGLVRISRGDRVEALVLGQHARQALIAHPARRAGAGVLRFWREGMWHVVIGLDHVLFLIALLLPVATGIGRGAPALARVLLETAGLVSAFTVAHSVTLAAAVFELVSVPPRLVESLIAATVLLVAADNLRPLFGRWRAMIAFALGLVHGLGFAGALQALGLPPAALGQALVAFNVGVECAQLVLVAVVVSVAYGLRQWWPWRRLLLPAVSVCVALVAALWLLQRALEVRVPPV